MDELPFINGVRYFPNTTQEYLKAFSDLPTKSDDVIVCTWPKSVLYGSWFDHVLGWWKHKDDPRILFLKYEDMKIDLPGTIEKIARFVKKDLSSNEVERIANQTTFKYMKEDDSVGYTKVFPPGTFIRKGEVGDWRNYFTPEQNRLFDEMYAERMKGTGLEFDFGEEKEE